MSKITGGTARMFSRRPTPASQSRPAATQNSRMALPAAAFFALVCPASHARAEARRRRAMPGNDDVSSRRALETRQRFVDLEAARLGFFALLALAFDHVLRRAGDEVGIGKLGVDAGDVGFNARHFLLE